MATEDQVSSTPTPTPTPTSQPAGAADASLRPSTTGAADSGQRVLLIGGTGYVGDVMRRRLRDAGHDVTLVVRSADRSAALKRDGFAIVEGDATDAKALRAAVQSAAPQVVINLVAIIREEKGVTFEALNYGASVNAIDAASAAGVPRFIQMSALGAHDNPDYPYHFHKWRAEEYLRQSGLQWTIFRPSIIFGPGEKTQFVSQLADIVRSAPVIPVVGDGSSRFQPVHLNDVADSFERAVRDVSTAGETYDLGGAEVLTYEEILDACAEALGKRKRKVHVPVALMMPAAAVMGAIPFITAPVTTDQLKMLKLDNTTSANAVPHLVGHPPIPFRGNITYIAKTS